MMWTPNTVNLLFIGWVPWLLWVVLGFLVSIPTSSDGWERVPRLLSAYGRAARRRIEKIPDLGLSSSVEEAAVVLEARERWLTWRLLSVVFSGLLASLLPLTLLMLFTPAGPGRREGTGLALDRLPSAVGTTAVAIFPMAVTATALIFSASRLSRTWPSDVEVWRHLHMLLRDESCLGWGGAAMRRTRSLRNLAAALERDFMRVAAVSDPSRLRLHQRAVVGGVLDHHDWLVRQPSRAVNGALTRRFASAWLAGDWSSLHPGTVRDHPALPQREPWFGRRGVVIVVVVYLAVAAAVFLGNYDDQKAWSSTIGVLITPLVIVVLGASVRSWGESRRSRNDPAPGPPTSRSGADGRDDQEDRGR